MSVSEMFTMALVSLAFAGTAMAQGDPAGTTEFFENRIRPLLVEHCYGCHSRESGQPVKGGLLLDSRDGWERGGDRGPAIVPGFPGKSLLIAAVRYEDADMQMPPKSKLSEAQIADLVRWVENGAPDPRVEVGETDGPGVVEAYDLAKRRRHWAWQSLWSGTVPRVRDPSWARDDLDRFILARLEEKGLEPAPRADRRTLVRRVTFDLTGLPPLPGEVETFLADVAPNAYERLVDRLLASPHFGEKWGQHWLDLARYAETYGHEGDYENPQAYRYRDYVVGAFNDDVSYDRFIAEHVAGDLLSERRIDPLDRSDLSIQGTGFWHFGEQDHAPINTRVDEADRVQNQIDVFSKTFLGMSMGCARCHDHKFDAISTRDYYAFYGFLQSSTYQLTDVSDLEARRRVVAELTANEKIHRPPILEALKRLRLKQLDRLYHYLVAAANVSDLASLKAAAAREFPSGKLRLDVLERLVAHLGTVAARPRELLYALARLGEAAPKASVLAAWDDLESATRRRRETLEVVKSLKHGEGNFTPVGRPWTPADVVVDYGSCSEEDWLPVGLRFGHGPTRAGEVLLGSSPGRPVEGIVTRGSASAPVVLNGFDGALRTRTFEVVGDHLWYQVRGEGRVLVVADSHRLLHGPVHQKWLRQDLAGENGWRWVSQDLHKYLGHRVHIEFLPGAHFEVQRVVFAETEPAGVFEAPRPWLEALQDARDYQEFARATIELLKDSVRRLSTDLRQDPELLGHAGNIEWVNDHARLLEPQPELEAALASAFESFEAARDEITARRPEKVIAPVLLDGTPENEPIHLRGDAKVRTPTEVPRRFLETIVGAEASLPERGSGRLELVDALVGGQTPLVPRVLVNRLWHHLFGRAIVETVDDFGVLGKRPTHPRLLDHLSRRFVAGGWSLKRMIRAIVLSSTYRMSSHPSSEGDHLDPSNLLLHRMPIRRLAAEAIRDQILVVSGRFDSQMGGRGVRVHITPFMRSNRSPKSSGPLDGDGRRSIYIEVRRNHLSAMFMAFDRPRPFLTLGKRMVSNSPAQPLILLNDPFVHEQAAIWAERLLATPGRSPTERLRDAYLQAFGRLPGPEELEVGVSFIEAQSKDRDEALAWKDFCHTLINVKEFIFVN